MLYSDEQQMLAQLNRIEEKLDRLLTIMNQTPTTATPGIPKRFNECLEHLQQGHKIKAIKVYREIFGVSLKAAKKAIEDIERDNKSISAESQEEKEQKDFERAVVELVHEGKKIHAIKVYRERTNVGLKEAKEAVEYLYDNTNNGKSW